jgi:hypothetical protein
VREDYSKQTQLRSGGHSADKADYPIPNSQEIQQSTTNKTTVLGFDYASQSAWGISAELPYIDRNHETIASGDTDVSGSDKSGFGDIRALGRYQFTFNKNQKLSLLLGFKLPTGGFKQVFSSGPQAGELLDRGLQLGSGTTDLLTGLSFTAPINDRASVFASALLDRPLDERDEFSPSTSIGLNVGMKFSVTDWFTPQLQLNSRFDGREHGAMADYDNSGGTFVFLSPGAVITFSQRSSAYALFQLPIYQYVNGLQLEPKWLVSAGVNFKL